MITSLPIKPNKVALITGAASGIGRALSLVCLARGISVVLVDKDIDKLHAENLLRLKDFPGQVMSFPCDVTKADEVAQLALTIEKQVGQVDWIYNNAGIIGRLAPVWTLTQEDLEQVMAVNVYGMMNVIRSFMPFLLKQETKSHLINMASLYALCTSSQTAAYAMSKHAVLALSEALYFDLKSMDKGVDVSVVFPSFTDTALLSTQPSSQSTQSMHNAFHALLSHSRPALECAEHIVNEVEKKQFYILPDKEVKGYCEDRSKAIVLQDLPHQNAIAQLMESMIKRNSKKSLRQ